MADALVDWSVVGLAVWSAGMMDERSAAELAVPLAES